MGALFIAAGALLWPWPSAAQEQSAWSEDHASRTRLIAGAEHEGARVAGLQIVLDDGYKTYWRHPGDSGLPPEINWTASGNVASVEMLFPAPRRFKDASGVFFGYADEVVLPLLVTPADPAKPMTLALELEYGACKEICIPAWGEMTLQLPASAPDLHPSAIAEALARVPGKRPLGAGDAPAILSVETGGPDQLLVRVRAREDALLFVEGPDYRWFLDPEAAMRPGGNDGEGVFAVDIAARPRKVDAPVGLTLTLASGEEAVETRVELAPSEVPAESPER